jgi:hypothetical protein
VHLVLYHSVLLDDPFHVVQRGLSVLDAFAQRHLQLYVPGGKVLFQLDG